MAGRRPKKLHAAVADAPVPLAKCFRVRIYHNHVVRGQEPLGKGPTQDVDSYRPAPNQSNGVAFFFGGGICRYCIDMHILVICLQCVR